MRWPLRLFAALALVTVVAAAHPAAATDDPLGNRQWALTQIHAPAAWSVSTGQGVKIGIVDSGVNRHHEDLTGKVIAAATCVNTSGNPANCTTGPNDGNDINGHGTHVAGIAAALTGNGVGIAGVAPDAKIIEARAFTPGQKGAEPTADLNDVKAGIEWVVSQGAQIVNLSVGVDTSGVNTCGIIGCGSNPLGPAVEEAWQRGALPIIASGNSNQQLFGGGPGYSNLDAIVVGATAPDGSVEPYSSAIGNAKWGLVAPGGDAVANNDPRCTDASSTTCPMVLSTYDGGTCATDAPNCYAYLSGTSMATPHVSGVAALLFAHGLTRQEVVDTLLATADPINCGTNCAGLLDAERALGAVPNDPNNGPNNGGTHTTTTVKHSGVGGVVLKKGGPTSTTPTTSPFSFKNEQPGPNTTFRPIPRAAIVLRSTPRSTKSIPVSVGFAGFLSLGIAALALSYNLRRTLTTLP